MLHPQGDLLLHTTQLPESADLPAQEVILTTTPDNTHRPLRNIEAKQQLKAQKAKVAKLQAQLAKTKKDDAAKFKTLNGQVTTLTGQVTTLEGQVATVTGQLTAANTANAATVATLNTQVATLTAKVTAQAQGGLAAVLAGNPADLWNAVLAIWQVFPKLPDTQYCGFDKRNNLTGGTGLNFADYTFSNTTNC